MTARVLVLDGRAISALAVARRLDRYGLEVHTGEAFSHTITGYSRSTAASHTYPSADSDPEAFTESLGSLIDRFEFEFVVPARDSTTRLLAEMKHSLPETTHTLLDSPEQIVRLQDKRRFAKLASRHDISIPDTYFPEEQGIEYVQQHADFPVVVKPTHASGARGIRRVERAGDLPDTYRAAKASDDEVIVQEFVDHRGGHYSIGTVFDRDGVPRAIHAYEELLQYPDSGGPAIRARSVAIEPWVHEMLGLLEDISWTGPAHMDVLFDPEDETYKLLEVNPRLWSSIALTIGSGVDIPRIMYDIGTDVDDDTGIDTGTDVGTDTGGITGSDIWTESSTDPGSVTGTDVGTESGTDTGSLTGSDVGTDGGTDTGSVTGPNVGTDSGADIESGTAITYREGNTYRWVFPNEFLWAADGVNTPARIRRLLRSDGRPTTYSILSRTDPTATLGAVVQSVRFLLDREKRTEMLGREMNES